MASLNPITGKLGIKKAAHLLRRTTFGPTKQDIEKFANMDISAAMDILLQDVALPSPPKDPATGSSWLPKPKEENSGDDLLFEYFSAWFLELMRNSSTNIKERMVYFLHTHLPADHLLIQNSTSLYYQNELYRRYALGSYKKLFPKVCVDNAMLLYIDNTLNLKDSPNENFAREMLELYSIGKGEQIGPEDYTNYTETDIKAAARVLTGFRHDFDYDMTDPLSKDPDTNLPRGIVKDVAQHDPEPKTFTDKFNNTVIKPPEIVGGYATKEGAFDELNQMIDMIFAQKETAKFICRKLYRFFVYYKIDETIEKDIIVPLAETFYKNNYEFPAVLRQLLSSQHFFDEDTAETKTHHTGALIKSPIDLVLGTFRFFNIKMLESDLPNLYNFAYRRGILRYLKNQGLKFYKPIDVAGYPPYHQTPAYNRNWISPNWLANRYQFGALILDGLDNEEGKIMYKLDYLTYIKDSANISDPSNATTLVKELVDYMFPMELPAERFDYFLKKIFMTDDMLSHWTDEWNEYKSSNDDTAVRGRLERLLRALMQAPEYQLH